MRNDMAVTIDEETRTHVAILNEEMGEVKEILKCHTKKWVTNGEEHATMKTDLAWIKWGVMLILGIVIVNMLGWIG